MYVHITYIPIQAIYIQRTHTQRDLLYNFRAFTVCSNVAQGILRNTLDMGIEHRAHTVVLGHDIILLINRLN